MVRAVVVAALAVTVLAAAGWMLWLAWLSAGDRVDAAGPASTAELLTLAASSSAIAVAAWLALGVALEVLAHLPGRVGAVAGLWADRLTPALARRVAAFVLGVGVGVVGGPSQAVGAARDVGMPVSAAPAPKPGFRPTHETVDHPAPAPGFEHVGREAGRPAPAPAPGFEPTPHRPSQPPPATPVGPSVLPAPGFTPSPPRVRKQADAALLGARPTGTAHADVHEVVVHRGDTLWSIAATHLGPDAEDAEVARAWPRWFEANRDVIGDDPDVVLPGQVLRVPDVVASAVR